MIKLATKVKELFNNSKKPYKRKESGQDLLECVNYTKMAVRAEKINLLRGAATPTQFNDKFDEITEGHYKKMKLRIRLIVSLKNFKTMVRLDA